VAEVYNWDVEVTIRVEGKTTLEFETFLAKVKELLSNARAAETIVGSKVKGKQEFVESEWHDGLS